MASVSIDTRISLLCPTLYSDSSKADWVALAEEKTSSSYYGDKYNEAAALMACHLFTLFSNASKAAGSGERFSMNTGSISHVKEGDLSVNFAAPASTDAIAGASTPSLTQSSLMQTRYGAMLLTLRKSIVPFMSVVTG